MGISGTPLTDECRTAGLAHVGRAIEERLDRQGLWAQVTRRPGLFFHSILQIAALPIGSPGVELRLPQFSGLPVVKGCTMLGIDGSPVPAATAELIRPAGLTPTRSSIHLRVCVQFSGLSGQPPGRAKTGVSAGCCRFCACGGTVQARVSPGAPEGDGKKRQELLQKLFEADHAG
jgi:hypothetical protein